MDNLEINPSEFFYAIKDVKKAIEELNDVKMLLQSISNLNYDMSAYSSKIERIDLQLRDLSKNLKDLCIRFMQMDSNIMDLFKYLNSDGTEANFGETLEQTKEDRLDNLKGNNNDLGGKRSKHSTSILSEGEKMLDQLKGNNKGLGGHITNNASSLLLGGIK